MDATGRRALTAARRIHQSPVWVATACTVPRGDLDPTMRLAAGPGGYAYRLGSARWLTVGWVGPGRPPSDGAGIGERIAENGAGWLSEDVDLSGAQVVRRVASVAVAVASDDPPRPGHRRRRPGSGPRWRRRARRSGCPTPASPPVPPTATWPYAVGTPTASIATSATSPACSPPAVAARPRPGGPTAPGWSSRAPPTPWSRSDLELDRPASSPNSSTPSGATTACKNRASHTAWVDVGGEGWAHRGERAPHSSSIDIGSHRWFGRVRH